MSGIDNLRPPQTTEEARERGAKGGKASGVARRKKREAKETAKLLLHLAAAGQLDTYLEQLGVSKHDRTNQTGIIARHIVKAQTGDEKSARLVFELSGDLSKQVGDNSLSVNIANTDEQVVIVLPDNGRDN